MADCNACYSAAPSVQQSASSILRSRLCLLASANHHVFWALQHCLASKGWKIIIADESHTLRTSEKPPDARHTEAAVSAVRRSRRAVFLTGTPSLSRPFDLFRQVGALYIFMSCRDSLLMLYGELNISLSSIAMPSVTPLQFLRKKNRTSWCSTTISCD